MTPRERRSPKLLNASRKKRVAAGSGTSVQEINKLLKMHRQIADMMKKLGKGKGGLASMFGMGGGGAPDMAEMAEGAGLDPDKLPKGLPPMPPGGLPGLPGMGGYAAGAAGHAQGPKKIDLPDTN